MNLTNIYMDNLKLSSDSVSTMNISNLSTSNTTKKKFDDFMQDTTKRQQSSNNVNERRDTASQNNNKSKVNDDKSNSSRDNSKVNSSSKEDNATKKDVNSDKVGSDKSKPDKIESNEVKADEVKPNEVENKDEKIISELSEELEIPIEVIEQILSQMNISPMDLMQPEKLTEFMQEAMQVDSPVELLSIPNIKETLDSIKSNLSKYSDSSEGLENTEDNLSTTFANSASKDMQTSSSMSGNGGNANNGNNSNANTQNNVIVESESNISSAQNQANKTEFLSKLTKTEAFKNVNPEEVIKQIIENLKTDAKEGISEIKMILKPESLGEISLKVMTQNGIVTAEFIAQNEKIKQILEANFKELKNVLQEQGLVISSLSVSVGEEDSQSQMQRFLHEQKKSSARVSNIIKNISEEESAMENIPDESEVLENNVNYIA